MNIFIIITIILLSLILGVLDYYGNIKKKYDYENDSSKPLEKNPFLWTFFQIWDKSMNFLVAGLIAYYFAYFRFPALKVSQNYSLFDFALISIFLFGIFRLLPFVLLNITKGIYAIIERFLNR
jgi:hypothetical protein